MQQRVVVLAGDQDDVAAAAAVAAARSAARDKLLAPERQTAVAAVAGFDRNDDFVDKHEYAAKRIKAGSVTSRPERSCSKASARRYAC